MRLIPPLASLLRQTAAAAVAFAAVTSAHAAPLSTSAIPEDTRWIMHLDFDAARASPGWDVVRARFLLKHFADVQGKLKAIENVAGIDIATQLHGLTLFGTGFDESSACLLIHAPIDQPRLINFLKLNPEYATIDNHGQNIFVWRDKGHDRLVYGAFAQIADSDVAIIAPSPQSVALALDTLGGRSAALKDPSPLLPPTPATAAAGPAARVTVLWVAARAMGELPRIQKVESPFLVQMENASIAIGTTEDRVFARMAVTALNEKAAQQMAAAADGMKAMVALSAADERSPARVKLLASALQALTITTNARSITADWSLSFEKLAAVADIARTGATTSAPATRRAEPPPLP